MKRYDLSDHCAEQGLLVRTALGDFIRYADHLGFVERVKELAIASRHADGCESFTQYERRPGVVVIQHNPEKCTCIRGELLAVCGEVK